MEILSLRVPRRFFEPNVLPYWTILAYLMPDHHYPAMCPESEKRRALRGKPRHHLFVC